MRALLWLEVQRRKVLFEGLERFTDGLEHGPAQGFGHSGLLGLGLADLIDGAGEELDRVEPVDGDLCVLEGLTDSGQDGRRHIADHFATRLGPFHLRWRRKTSPELL